MSFINKAKSAVKNYASNVAGGAKIVSGAIKGTPQPSAPPPAPKLNLSSQIVSSNSYNNSRTTPASTYKAPAPNPNSSYTPPPTYAYKPSVIAPTNEFGGSKPITNTYNNSNSTPNQIGSQYTALKSALGTAGGGIASTFKNIGSAVEKSGIQPGVANISVEKLTTKDNPYYKDNYKDKPGVTVVNQEAQNNGRGGMSNEAKVKAAQDSASGAQVGQERNQRTDFLNTSAGNREAEIASLQGQISNTQAALEATMAAEAAGVGLQTDLDANMKIDPIEAQYATEEKESMKLEKQLEALQKAFQKAQELSPEEISAREDEDKLTAQEASINAQVGEETTAINTQPIPQGFLTGQGKAVYEKGNSALTRIAAQKIPLQQKLANIMAKRKMAEEAVKDSMGYATDAYSRSSSKSKDKREYSVNIAKEKREQQMKAAEAAAKANEPRELSEGVAVWDPVTKRVIYRNPKTYAPRSSTPGSTSGSPTNNNDVPPWISK